MHNWTLLSLIISWAQQGRRAGLAWDWCVLMYYEALQLSSTARAEVKWRWKRWLHARSCQKPDIWCRLLRTSQANSLKFGTVRQVWNLMWWHNWSIHPQIQRLIKAEKLSECYKFDYKAKEVFSRIHNPTNLTLRCTC